MRDVSDANCCVADVTKYERDCGKCVMHLMWIEEETANGQQTACNYCILEAYERFVSSSAEPNNGMGNITISKLV